MHTKKNSRHLLFLFTSFLFAVLLEVSSEPTNLRQDIAQAINQYRQANGIPTLTLDSQICDVAEEHAQNLRLYKFDHLAPDGSSAFTRVIRRGIPAATVGENLAEIPLEYQDQEIGDLLLKRMLESPEHRRNIINPSFNRIGVSIIKDSNRYYTVQVFVQRP